MKITSRIYAYINQHTHPPQLGAGTLELKQPRLSRHLLLSSFPIQFIFTKNSCLHVFYEFSWIFAKQLVACNVYVMRL